MASGSISRMKGFVSSLFFLIFCLIIAPVNGQYFALDGVKTAPPLSLTTMARFFVYSTISVQNGKHSPAILKVDDFDEKYFEDAYPGSEYITRVPPFGWGIWDSKTPRESELSLDNVYFVPTDPKVVAGNGSAYELGLMDYSDFWNIFIPYQKKQHFCCTTADVTAGTCPEANRILLPADLKAKTQLYKVPFQSNPLSAKAPINKSGIHFLLMINCSPDAQAGSFVGSATVTGSHGYLSGIDVPKLELYALGSIVYGAFLLVWAIICFRYARQLILLHHLMTMVITVGFLEQLVWYVLLSFVNKEVPPPKFLLFVAVCFSVVKNVISVIIILLACLGLCITRPTLEGSTWRKVGLLTAGFLVLDALREAATQFHVSYELSFGILLICAFPITLLYSAVVFWSFISLTSIINELTARRQLAKLKQMTRFRAVLIFAIALFVLSTTIETLVMTSDVQKIWPFEWVFTDAIPNVIFLMVLMVMVFLWRPTRSSKYYSYNMELPDSEFIGGGAIEVDRIRTDVNAKAFEMGFDFENGDPRTLTDNDKIRDSSFASTAQGSRRGLGDSNIPVLSVNHPSVPSPNNIRVWGELDLDLDDETENPLNAPLPQSH